MKYMKRVFAELEIVGGGLEEEEIIVQRVRFAFSVHQIAGGFDVETKTAFEELRDKANLTIYNARRNSNEGLLAVNAPDNISSTANSAFNWPSFVFVKINHVISFFVGTNREVIILQCLILLFVGAFIDTPKQAPNSQTVV